jgi:hypothetical protein
MKPAVFKVPRAREPKIDRINRFKGVNKSVDPTQLDHNESPDMMNMVLDTEEALDKRTGYALLFPTPLVGKIHTIHQYRKADGTEVNLLHCGTKLYTFLLDGTQPTEIYTGLADSKSNFFNFTDKCYIQDGINYLEYDGTTVQEPIPYIPTLFISTPPAGGGTAFEDFNLLGTKFKQSFSGDGAAVDFQLALDNLDATTVTATVNTITKVEGTDFTVNRTTGVVTFSVAPSTGTPNNVVITAAKTVAGAKAKITSCKMNRLFGGTNDTKVFFWTGKDNILRRSDTYRPNYFPENAFQKVGADAEVIQNLVLQYDSCVIEKEFSKHIMRYEFDTIASFPVRPINDTVGCIAPYSSQIIENNPVTLTKNGVYLLRGGSVRDERNVSHQSNRVDKLLLSEPNLKDAITIDHDNKYFIVLNGNVYVWDYLQPHNHPTEIGQWVLWNNINATCLYEIGTRIYFGNANGQVCYFKKDGEQLAYRDIDQAIIWHWYGKNFAMGMDERRKLIEKLFVSIKPDSATSGELYYITDQVASDMIAKIEMNLFDYSNVNYANFSYLISQFPQVTMTKIKAKKIVYFQPYFKGQEIDESFGLLSLNIAWQPQSMVK